MGGRHCPADSPADSLTAPLRLARPRGRLLAPGSLGLGVGFSLSLGLDAAEKTSLLLKIVLAFAIGGCILVPVRRKPLDATNKNKIHSMKTKLCSSCYRGDITEPATVAVTGLLNNRPYRANLCDSHLAGLKIYEGLEVRSCYKIESKPSRLDLREQIQALRAIYSTLCATATLDEAGFALIQAAKDRYIIATIDAGDIY